MATVFRKGDIVTDVKREVRYVVECAHLDGTYTVVAKFGLNEDGSDRPSYLGYRYRKIVATALRPFRAEQVSA